MIAERCRLRRGEFSHHGVFTGLYAEKPPRNDKSPQGGRKTLRATTNLRDGTGKPSAQRPISATEPDNPYWRPW